MQNKLVIQEIRFEFLLENSLLKETCQLDQFQYIVKKRIEMIRRFDNLITIGSHWYFWFSGYVPQKLINWSLHNEIILLQKFNDIGGRF